MVGDLEVIDQDITISIHGLGFSLVNNINQVELLYMCIARFVRKFIILSALSLSGAAGCNNEGFE